MPRSIITTIYCCSWLACYVLATPLTNTPSSSNEIVTIISSSNPGPLASKPALLPAEASAPAPAPALTPQADNKQVSIDNNKPNPTSEALLSSYLESDNVAQLMSIFNSPAPSHISSRSRLASAHAQQSSPAGQSSSSNPNSLLPLQLAPLVSDPLALLESSWQKINASLSPRSDKLNILSMFQKYFIKARSHDDQAQKEYVRDGVVMRLRELGFETSFLQKSRFEFRRKAAINYNVISILPGKYRQTKKDRIILIGAHWDSATKAPGVDDNGSGSVCLLEIARIISENKCLFEHTIMLVWFDYEEQGKFGSEFFVNDYLFPLELEKYNSKFIGAFILDMILVRDKDPNTQLLPVNLNLAKLKDFTDELERDKYSGDFLATWSRKTWDEPLESSFRNSWQDLGYESRTFKAMRPELPQMRLPNSEERYEWKDFFRSDHASFWFPPLTSNTVKRSPNRTSTVSHTSLNAILLTDLGPWRKSYQRCYHSPCDDEHFLTDGNLAFMQQVVDSLVLTLLRLGHGECSASKLVASGEPSAQLVMSTTTTSTTTSTTTPTPSTAAPDKPANVSTGVSSESPATTPTSSTTTTAPENPTAPVATSQAPSSTSSATKAPASTTPASSANPPPSAN